LLASLTNNRKRYIQINIITTIFDALLASLINNRKRYIQINIIVTFFDAQVLFLKYLSLELFKNDIQNLA